MLFGLLGVTAVLTAAYATYKTVKNQRDAEYQKQQNAINMANNYLSTLDTQYSALNEALSNLKLLEKDYNDAIYNKQVNLDLIEQYNAALNSDKGVLDENNEFLTQKYLLNQQLENLDSEKELYKETSAQSQKDYVINSFSQYAEMMREKSIQNVVASASGNKGTAYSIDSLVKNNQIKDFIGEDLTFNYDGESNLGSFAQTYSLQKQAIDEQVKAYEYNANAIMANLISMNQDFEDMIKSLTNTNEGLDSIINDYEGESINSKKYYEEAMKRAQDNAKVALQEYEKMASEGQINQKEIDRQKNQYKEMFKQLGYEI